tara:strand:+ start:484 stop:1506 length:1023 start_codon:yes stop_codon:yes gene_type:complete
MKNIIFLVDAQQGPSGGGKVIYQYSNYINSLKDFSSSVAHLKKKKINKWMQSINKRMNLYEENYTGWKANELTVKKNYFFSWFNVSIKSKNNLVFDKKKDFVILPEIFAHLACDLLIKKKIKYAIFVQNGYALFPTYDLEKLNKSYNNAKFILSYSKDIKSCISLAFPKIKKKIVDVKYSIDKNKLNSQSKKLNLITFMPRKLKKHSELTLSFLKNNLPKKWKLKAIHNMSEKEVFKNLKKSKIFLSFSELEGLPLPPVEAALAGNQVIGYTGEGGKEYWRKPIFTEIKTGELKIFCREILRKIKIKDFLKKTKKQRVYLANQFSSSKEKVSIKNFLKLI